MDQVHEAERLYRQALDMNPNLWDVYAQFGDFLLTYNRPVEAAQMYKKVRIENRPLRLNRVKCTY